MELYRGAHIISCEIGGRPLKIPLLWDEYGALLFDAGTRFHAERDIPAYFQEIGLSHGSLQWLVLSHPDLDHCGGSPVVARNYPNVRILCGKEDREQIEDPDVLFEQRYDHYREAHGIFYDPATALQIRDAFAGIQHVSATFSGGEEIRLGPGRIIEVLQLPGHSHGHLGLYDRRNGTLYYGDAIQGAGYRSISGDWVMGPTYLYVDQYLDSIARIRNLGASRIVGCHWPGENCQAEITRFCDETAGFVQQADAEVLRQLALCEEGATLAELCKRVGQKVGNWPSAAHTELCYPLLGHLERAIANQKVIADNSVRPVVYRAVSKKSA